jgi:uncharacterized protein YyaL (SSP411 family)
MSNHLLNETSPYLLQHATNPVDWYPWNTDALEKARLEDKPIFLSIGYAACHWCHVMAHESFEDVDTAEFMNQHFVNIKVDREERPDLDGIYMRAVVAITGQGGWPMSVFLTPEGKPFYGGTYFPPNRRSHGKTSMPSFREILQTIARLWSDERSRLMESSDQITEHLQRQRVHSQDKPSLDNNHLNHVVKRLEESYDWEFGGWGQAPKFPQPMTLEFLIRRGLRGDQTALELVSHSLKAMAKGGMYDVVGGGFSRYSVDNRWLTPHFEKMLYDNAQLASTYLHMYLVSKNNTFRQICEETLDFILRELTHPDGGFYSSLDADSEGIEGKYYLWTLEEIQNTLRDDGDISFITAAYGITSKGNFDGKNILQRVITDEQLEDIFATPLQDIRSRLSSLHQRLLSSRMQRVPPATDDKILVSWNALALKTFAEAGRYLKRLDYLLAAIRNASFLLENLFWEDRLLRSWRDSHEDKPGRARHNAYLEDYSGLILALLALYQSDPNLRWYNTALKLAEEMIEHFSDPEGGFFDTRDDHQIWFSQADPLPHPKELQDNATPSGNALAVTALLMLVEYGNRPEWGKLAEGILATIQEMMVAYPTAFAQWLQAADFLLGPVTQVTILGDPGDTQTQALVDTLWSNYNPNLVAAISFYPPEPFSPVLLQNRTQLDNQPTAYVCQDFTCLLPTHSPVEMAGQLSDRPTTSAE